MSKSLLTEPSSNINATDKPVTTGRPQIKIDWRALDALCAVQCTLAEIAAHFGVSEDTIERAVKREQGASFADYFEQKRKGGFASLRRKQYQVAMSGNVTMLIWLGKQWLGQADRQDACAQNTTLILDL